MGWIFFHSGKGAVLRRMVWTWRHARAAFIAGIMVYAMGIVLTIFSMGFSAAAAFVVYGVLATILGIILGWSADTARR